MCARETQACLGMTTTATSVTDQGRFQKFRPQMVKAQSLISENHQRLQLKGVYGIDEVTKGW